uniref:WGS project CAEQ00000000 data, annotated contig 1337 n=1 Tax=Trypanosoma congolense (strain IL3000) TaxID=1068625 RepID=F9W5K8_TRYCI|nr:unnamed protein product [Trypanosoma congolense IL3000]
MDISCRASPVDDGGINESSIQSQVEFMYASILASVEMAMDREAAETEKAKKCPAKTGRSRDGAAASRTNVTEDNHAVRSVGAAPHDDVSIKPQDYNRKSNSKSRLAAPRLRCGDTGAEPSEVVAVAGSPSVRRAETATTNNSQRRLPPSTFGTGRKEISEPVRKTASPGPGSYFCTDNNSSSNGGVVRARGGDDNKSRQRQDEEEPPRLCGSTTKQKADKDELRRRQMKMLCQCYWKEMDDIEAPENPAAHAADCPCQTTRAPCNEWDDRSAHDVSDDENNLAYRRSGSRVKTRDRLQASISVVSPRLVGRLSSRGAIFGTSPRRTIFDGKESDTGRGLRNRSAHQRRGRSEGEPMCNVMPEWEAEFVGNDEMSFRERLARRGAAPSTGVETSPGPGTYDVSGGFSGYAPSTMKAVGAAFIGRAERKLHTTNNVPGPGAYNPGDKGVSDSTKQGQKSGCTLPASQRHLSILPTKEMMHSPGPGEYYVPSGAHVDARNRSPPAFSFSRAKLSRCGNLLLTKTVSPESADGPGPGTYDISTSSGDGRATFNKRSAIITAAKRGNSTWVGERASPPDGPGPGTYDPAKVEGGPAYLIGHRPTEHVEETPGPGQYELPQMSSGPQWLLSERPSSRQEYEPTPGPGEYSFPHYDLKCTHSSAPLFPTAPRVLHEQVKGAESLPGPGTYNTDKLEGTTRSAVMGTARRSPVFGHELHEEVPGPGAYTVEYTAREPRVASPLLGTTASRFSGGAGVVNNAETPGPGAYEVAYAENRLKGYGAVIGSAPREMLRGYGDTVDEPGPGAYDTTIPKDGPSFSMGQKYERRTEPEDSTPGPGKYDPRDSALKAPCAVIGDAPRFHLGGEEKKRLETPGPGAYMPEFPSSPPGAVVFGAGPRFVGGDTVPGNGCSSEPGPGSYHPQVPEKGIPGAAWSTEPRFVSEGVSEVPGPGAYEVRPCFPHNNAVNFAFSCGKCSEWAEGKESGLTPGPGAYAPRDMQDRTAPSAVFGSSPQRVPSLAEREALMRTGVGPGSYEVITPSPHSFHVTFGSSANERVPEDQRDEHTIGPGHYNPHDVATSCSRSAYIGSAPRLQSHKDSHDAPGPGTYSPGTYAAGGLLVGPVSFSTASRFDDGIGVGINGVDGATPGPGYYSVETEGTLGAAGRAPVFGKGPRVLDLKEREHSLFPGPSQYQAEGTSTKAGGPAYSFGAGPRMLTNDIASNSGLTPGPGAYDVNAPTFTQPCPRFGVEARNLGSPTCEEGPGPGTYNTEAAVAAISPTGPVHRFPTAAREAHDAATRDVPGPGQYGDWEVDNFAYRRLAAPSFPIGPRFVTQGNARESPGPGQYTPYNPQWDALPAHSFLMEARATSVGNEMDIPGPGRYDPRLPASVPHVAPFGTAPRPAGGVETDAIKYHYPGPGHYNPVLPVDSPGIRFTTAQRNTAAASINAESPGPGAYDVKVTGCEERGFQFMRAAAQGPSMVDMERARLPGPGAYSVPPAFPVTGGPGAAASFDRAPRFPYSGETQTEGPGPGAYDVEQTRLASGPFIGKAPRFTAEPVADNKNDDVLPGPGYYEINRGNLWSGVDGGVAMRFTSKRFPEDYDGAAGDVPGPASYSPVDTKGIKGGYSFPQAPRCTASDMHNTVSPPGPGEYDIPSTFCAAGGGSYSFGVDARMKDRGVTEHAPGPGSYDAARFMEHYQVGPAFSLKGKPLDRLATDDVPGPGSYNASRFMEQYCSGPAFSLKGKPTCIENAEEVPGPGSYDAARYTEQHCTGPAFTLRGKPTHREGENDNEVPGPGSYDAARFMEHYQVGPAFSLKGKPLDRLATDDVPGPGSYNASRFMEQYCSGPAFSLKGKPTCIENAEEVPGPGSYDAARYTEQHCTGPAFTLRGKPTHREGENDNEVPGPGMYSLHPVSTRAASFGVPPTIDKEAVFEAHVNESPGPAAYSIPSTLDQKAAAFGVAERSKGGKEENAPGPGAYLTGGPVVVMGGPAFQFGKQPRFTEATPAASNAPGPGAYHHPIEIKSSAPTFAFTGADRFVAPEPSSGGGPGVYYHPYPRDGVCNGPSLSFPKSVITAAGR